MGGLVLLAIAVVVLVVLGVSADRFGVDSRDWVGDSHLRGSR